MAWVTKKVYQVGNPRSLHDLKEKIHRAWNELDVVTIRKWMEELKPRLRKCIEENGKHVHLLFNKL
jgi:hypothetical protein